MVLQRQCACGNRSAGKGECDSCAKKTLQRNVANAAPVSQGPTAAPPIVHDVLRSPGRPLDAATRAYMEPRFGYDFSRVRVHTDARAAESAEAVNSLAYTVGRDVVFGHGQYAPHDGAGRRLLAHELTHVMQQGAAGYSGSRLDVSPAEDSSERDADLGADSVLARDERVLRRPTSHPVGTLQRKMKVAKPAAKIPNPGGKGVDQTNAATVESYLSTLCTGGKAAVDPGSGDVSIGSSFCTKGHGVAIGLGIGGGLALGAAGAAIGHAAGGGEGRGGLIGGIVGGALGAVGGAVGGALLGNLFDKSPAESSSTPTGCGCICDLAASNNQWTIVVDDASWPHTNFDNDAAAHGKAPGGSGGTVTTPSPNSPKLWGAAAVSGKELNIDPWLVLGHELCGHGWLGNAGKHAPDRVAPRGEGGHQATVERENLLRAEHGIEARGTFKDPNCGESFSRDKAAPGTVDWSSYRATCEAWRKDYNKKHGTSYKITDRIP